MLLLQPAVVAQVSATEGLVASEMHWHAPQSAVVQSVPMQTNRIHLTMIFVAEAARAVVRFGSGANQGQLIGEASRFGVGLTALHYRVDLRDAAGKPFREEWTVNGQRQPNLDRRGTIPIDTSVLSSAIALSTGNPLPPGTYQLRILVNEQIVGEGQAVIE
jgi:hypothetical protein